jgi:hypothetical protein
VLIYFSLADSERSVEKLESSEEHEADLGEACDSFSGLRPVGVEKLEKTV